MWRDLAPIGRTRTGGYRRQPWTSPERELRAWFVAAATARGLRLETDGVGNAIAWWDKGSGPAVVTGSHLDSVIEGGSYDGPLGVVSALAALDAMRAAGFEPSRPLGIGVFVEEEGSRFGMPCLGSRLAVGAVRWPDVRERRDRDGVCLADAVEAEGLGGSGSWPALDGVGCFVELHVEQGRQLADRGAAVGLTSGIWPHGRYRFDFAGEANHAGTTRMEDRRDPIPTFAMTALAAGKQARLTGDRATFGRVEVNPNATNAVPSSVTAWLDARAPTDERLAALVDAISRQAFGRASRDGTTLAVTAESVSAATDFDPALIARLGHERGWPVLATQAGHDAGILAGAGIPTAMLMVRNPTGVSHAPEEHAETADCLAGVDALADVLAELTR